MQVRDKEEGKYRIGESEIWTRCLVLTNTASECCSQSSICWGELPSFCLSLILIDTMNRTLPYYKKVQPASVRVRSYPIPQFGVIRRTKMLRESFTTSPSLKKKKEKKEEKKDTNLKFCLN